MKEKLLTLESFILNSSIFILAFPYCSSCLSLFEFYVSKYSSPAAD